MVLLWGELIQVINSADSGEWPGKAMSNWSPWNDLGLQPEWREGVMPHSNSSLSLGNRKRSPAEGANMSR